MIAMPRILILLISFLMLGQAFGNDDLLLRYDDVKYAHTAMTIQKPFILNHRLKLTWQGETTDGETELTPEHLTIHGLEVMRYFPEPVNQHLGFAMQVVLTASGNLAFNIVEGKHTQHGVEPKVLLHHEINPTQFEPFDFDIRSPGTDIEYHLTLSVRATPLPSEGYLIDQKIQHYGNLLKQMRPMRELSENYHCLIEGHERAYGVAPDYVRLHGVHIGIPRAGQNLSIGHHSVYDGREILLPWMPLEFQIKVENDQLHFVVFEVPPHVKKVSSATLGKLSHTTLNLQGQESLILPIPSQLSSKEYRLNCTRRNP